MSSASFAPLVSLDEGESVDPSVTMAKAYCKVKKDEDKKPNEGPLAFLGLQRKSVDEEDETENGEDVKTKKREDGDTKKEKKEKKEDEDTEKEEEEQKEESGEKNEEEKMEEEKDIEEEEDAMEVDESNISTNVEETNKEATSPVQSEEQTEKESETDEQETENVADAESQIQVHHLNTKQCGCPIFKWLSHVTC